MIVDKIPKYPEYKKLPNSSLSRLKQILHQIAAKTLNVDLINSQNHMFKPQDYSKSFITLKSKFKILKKLTILPKSRAGNEAINHLAKSSDDIMRPLSTTDQNINRYQPSFKNNCLFHKSVSNSEFVSKPIKIYTRKEIHFSQGSQLPIENNSIRTLSRVPRFILSSNNIRELVKSNTGFKINMKMTEYINKKPINHKIGRAHV